MLTKQVLIQTIDKLPSSFTLDDLLDKLIFIEKVNEGLKQSKQGKTVRKPTVKYTPRQVGQESSCSGADYL